MVIAPTPELLPGGSLEEPWRPSDADASLSLEYEAGGAFASADGTGRLEVSIDDELDGAVEIDGAGLYELAAHPHHERHALRVEASPGVGVWSISFAPGVPPPGRARRP